VTSFAEDWSAKEVLKVHPFAFLLTYGLGPSGFIINIPPLVCVVFWAQTNDFGERTWPRGLFIALCWWGFFLAMHVRNMKRRRQEAETYQRYLTSQMPNRVLSHASYSANKNRRFTGGFCINEKGDLYVDRGKAGRVYNRGQIRQVRFAAPFYERVAGQVYNVEISPSGHGTATPSFDFGAMQANWHREVAELVGQEIVFKVDDPKNPVWSFWCPKEKFPSYEVYFERYLGVRFPA
jgi:hypothetical protein